MGKIKLKPCPFCGAAEEEISVKAKRYHGGAIDIQGNKFWFVECLPCDVRTGDCFDGDAEHYGFKTGKEVAINHWNTRSTTE